MYVALLVVAPNARILTTRFHRKGFSKTCLKLDTTITAIFGYELLFSIGSVYVAVSAEIKSSGLAESLV